MSALLSPEAHHRLESLTLRVETNNEPRGSFTEVQGSSPWQALKIPTLRSLTLEMGISVLSQQHTYVLDSALRHRMAHDSQALEKLDITVEFGESATDFDALHLVDAHSSRGTGGRASSLTPYAASATALVPSRTSSSLPPRRWGPMPPLRWLSSCALCPSSNTSLSTLAAALWTTLGCTASWVHCASPLPACRVCLGSRSALGMWGRKSSLVAACGSSKVLVHNRPSVHCSRAIVESQCGCNRMQTLWPADCRECLLVCVSFPSPQRLRSHS